MDVRIQGQVKVKARSRPGRGREQVIRRRKVRRIAKAGQDQGPAQTDEDRFKIKIQGQVDRHHRFGDRYQVPGRGPGRGPGPGQDQDDEVQVQVKIKLRVQVRMTRSGSRSRSKARLIVITGLRPPSQITIPDLRPGSASGSRSRSRSRSRCQVKIKIRASDERGQVDRHHRFGDRYRRQVNKG